jgi:hypothetical protein
MCVYLPVFSATFLLFLSSSSSSSSFLSLSLSLSASSSPESDSRCCCSRSRLCSLLFFLFFFFLLLFSLGLHWFVLCPQTQKEQTPWQEGGSQDAQTLSVACVRAVFVMEIIIVFGVVVMCVVAVLQWHGVLVAACRRFAHYISPGET